jgi:endonuclease/exonuclease/phosphatase family metal-dependent hydrolase
MSMRRTSPSSVLFSTYNLLNLAESSGQHYEAVVAVIRSLDTDVLAVQEVLAPDPAGAAVLLRTLAADAGLRCEVPGDGTAVTYGGHGYHVGLMWREGIEPVPDSLRRFGGADFWHGLALVTLDVGGTLVRHASFHASPFCRMLRADQNERLVAAITRSRDSASPALIGADWNAESADRILAADGTLPLYEGVDPYAEVPWFADMVYQCEWDYGPDGARRHWADRRSGDVLWAGGLHDTAAVLGVPWQATTGHHPDDVYAQHGVRRRIDTIRVTPDLVPAMRGHQATTSDQAKAASDHLPVTVDYLPTTLHP